MSLLHKVVEIEKSDYGMLKRTKLLCGLILNKCSVLVSIPFLQKTFEDAQITVSQEIMANVAVKAGLTFVDGNFYDKNGNLLNSDTAILVSAQELANISEKVLKREDNSGVLIASMARDILEKRSKEEIYEEKNTNDYLVVKEKETDLEQEYPAVISIEELKSKLFDAQEKGRTK